jgi:hypothetical protein
MLDQNSYVKQYRYHKSIKYYFMLFGSQKPLMISCESQEAKNICITNINKQINLLLHKHNKSSQNNSKPILSEACDLYSMNQRHSLYNLQLNQQEVNQQNLNVSVIGISERQNRVIYVVEVSVGFRQ